MYIGFLEDEPELSQHVCEILESAGHSVALFNNGQDMIRAIGRDTMDLFVLDWRVPRVTGIEVLKHIRLVKGLKEPVLFLTSKSDEQDIIEALNAGADDYCTKPVRPREFLARVQALLRRTYPDKKSSSERHELHGYLFDPVDSSVSFDGKTVQLAEKEFKLARFLFDNTERAVSRERLIQEVWGNVGDDISRSLDVHISWLRKKLDLSASATKLKLKPIYGFGYRLVVVGEAQDD